MGRLSVPAQARQPPCPITNRIPMGGKKCRGKSHPQQTVCELPWILTAYSMPSPVLSRLHDALVQSLPQTSAEGAITVNIINRETGAQRPVETRPRPGSQSQACCGGRRVGQPGVMCVGRRHPRPLGRAVREIASKGELRKRKNSTNEERGRSSLVA